MRPIAGIGLAAALIALAGCDSTSYANHPSSSHSSSTTPATSTSPSSPSTSATPVPALAGDCDTMLPLTAVESALGEPVVGRTAFVVNLPEASIGLLGRVNCRYGIGAAVRKGTSKVDPAPRVEVSISLYSTPEQATERVQGTADDWRGRGARQSTVFLDGNTATVLTGYGSPLLVVAHGTRTVAVTVVASLLSGRSPAAVLSQVADRAITGSNG